MEPREDWGGGRTHDEALFEQIEREWGYDAGSNDDEARNLAAEERERIAMERDDSRHDLEREELAAIHEQETEHMREYERD